MAYPVTAGPAAANTRPHSLPAIRRIGVTDLMDALSSGVRDFLAAPTQLFFLGLIYPLVGGVAAAAAAQADLVPLLYPALAGISIMGPISALGMYEISRQRELGVQVTWRHALDVRHAPALGSMVWLGVMLLALFIFWLAMAEQIYMATLAARPHATIVEFIASLLGTAEGWRMIIVGNVVGLGFAGLVLTLTVVSVPMMLHRRAGIVDAVTTSARAVWYNPVTMAVWGLIVAGLLLLGSLPLFVGLALVMPVLGHATWHLYRRMVAD